MLVKRKITILRQEREFRGWSRQYIAEQVGVDLVTVGRWERGERIPHPHYRQQLCELFQKNALELRLQKPAEPDEISVDSDPEPEVFTDEILVPPAPMLSRSYLPGDLKVVTMLRQERDLRGWSRQYIAEQVGVDLATVGRWERGERIPHPHYRQQLCELFQKNALELGLQKLAEPDEISVDSDPEPEVFTDEILIPPAPMLSRFSFSLLNFIPLFRLRIVIALTTCVGTLALFAFSVKARRNDIPKGTGTDSLV